MSIFSTASVLDQVVDLAKDLSDREIIPFLKKYPTIVRMTEVQ